MSENNDRIGNKLDEAQLRYLRAADYAQKAQYELAEAEFIAALSLNPELHTARFQLGLLQLSSGKPEQATASWAPLISSNTPPELREFVLGLEALIQDNFHESISKLQAGIKLNSTNPALNNDMQMVIANIHATIDNNHNTALPKSTENSLVEDVRTDFSLYGNKH